MAIMGVALSGLDLTVSARFTNSGTADAHNVQARVELFSGNQRVKINGQDYMQDSLGALAIGQVLERQEKLSLTAGDLIALLTGSKVTIKLAVSSDEITQEISYDYSP